MDYMERLTGMKTNELVEVSQDREAWRELVVACVDLQPPDYRERYITHTIYSTILNGLVQPKGFNSPAISTLNFLVLNYVFLEENFPTKDNFSTG